MSSTLKGVVRDRLGSRSSRKLRIQGRIPVCIQGESKGNLELSIDEDAFLAARRHHEHLFDIELDGADLETALVRELQWDAMGDRIIHVEFRRVIRGQKTDSEVEIEFVGHPKSGILNHLMTHVTINCLPSIIPNSIEVKIDSLEAGDSILIGDLVLPEGVEIVMDVETPVGHIIIPKVQEAEPEEEGVDVEGIPITEEGSEEAAGADSTPEEGDSEE